MFQKLITEQVLFYLADGMLAIAIIAELIVAVSLKRISDAAEDMGKSDHSLMKLMRAKFEHVCMVSDKVQDVKAFVEKYVHEYRVLGLRFNSWRKMSRIGVWFYAILCIIGAGGAYAFELVDQEIARYLVQGAAGILLITVLSLLVDEDYRLKAAKIYMIDFLGNTYAHRYEKEHPLEVAVAASAPIPEPIPEPVPEPIAETEPVSVKEEINLDKKKEEKIREILGEFLDV